MSESNLSVFWKKHREQCLELIRYLIAGGLTTVVSLIVNYGLLFLLVQKPERAGESLIDWLLLCVNSATAAQMSLAKAISWVVAVLFAYFINRGMVFHDEGNVWQGLWKFVLGRVASFLIIEQGVMLLLTAVGVPNAVNLLLIQVLVVIFNYAVSKLWVFKRKPEQKENS